MSEVFAHREYTIRRRVFTIFGAKFDVLDADGEPVLFSRQKALRLKGDIRVYSDETEFEERLTIRARSILDFDCAYDVVDSSTGETLGVLRRKGLKSVVRDSWEILGRGEKPLARLEEDSMVLALSRRIIGLIPQTFHARRDGVTLVTYRQNFVPFVRRLRVTLHEDGVGEIEPLLALAAGILLMAFEGRQGQI